MAELATAYVTIIPSMKGAARTIENELGGVNTTSSGKKMGGGLVSGISGGFTKLAGIGVKTIAGIGTAVGGLAIGGGISRALKLEQAQYKFKAMGLDVEKTMQSCNEAVTGTAYGLDAAATVASSLGASGVKSGKEMTNSLKAVAGLAAMSGRSMEDIGLIFGKVAATGKLQGDELNQFAESGVNALAALSSHLGKSQSEVREMVRNGEIDFKTFADAMYATFGDAAQGANSTFQGAMSNVMAALSRVGAKFATPALNGLQKVFVALIPAINKVSECLDPLVEQFGRFCEAASGQAVAAIEAFTSALDGGGSIMDGINASFGTLPDTLQKAASGFAIFSGIVAGGSVVSKLSGIGKAAAELVPKISKFPVLGGFVARFGEGFNDARVASSAFSGVAGTLGGKVASLVGSFKGFGSVTAMLSGPIGIAVAAVTGLIAAFAYLWSTNDTFRSSLVATGQQLMASLKPAFDSIMQAVTSLVPVFMSLVQAIAPVVTMIISAVVSVAAAVLPVIAQIIAAIVPLVAMVVSAAAQIASAILSTVIPVINNVLGVVTAVMPYILAIIKTVMNGIMSVVRAVWPVVSAIIKTAMNVIRSVVTIVLGVINGNWKQVWKGMKSLVTSVWNGIKSVISSANNAIRGVISAALNTIKGIWSSVWNGIKALVSSIMSSLQSRVSSGVSGVVSTVQSLPGKIKGFFSNAGSWLLSAGKAIINGLVKGIEGAVGKVKSALAGVTKLIPSWKGPLSVDKKLLVPNGEVIMRSLVDGINSGMGIVRSTLAGATDEIGGFAMDAGIGDVSGTFNASSVPTSDAGGTVYNIYFNDNKVNDDDEIRSAFMGLMRTMARKGAM